MANNTGPFNDISLPSPVNVKYESQDSSAIHKKANQMSIASSATSPVKRSPELRDTVTLPATKNN